MTKDAARRMQIKADIKSELGCWRSAGLRPQFWLRDDDAIDVTPQLERLCAVAERYHVQIGLAVIPASIGPALPGFVRGHSAQVWPLAHGWTHTNHRVKQPPGEFGEDRPEEDVRGDLVDALHAFKRAFPDRSTVFVPPYNHIAPMFVAALPDIGYCGLSSSPNIWESRVVRTLANNAWLRLPRLPVTSTFKRVDTHLDIIDWQARTAQSEDVVLHRMLGELRMRRKGSLPADYPIGILSHHLVHDEAIWLAMERLLDDLASEGTADFVTCQEVFGRPAPRAAESAYSRSVGG